jgi:hypothetical protein
VTPVSTPKSLQVLKPVNLSYTPYLATPDFFCRLVKKIDRTETHRWLDEVGIAVFAAPSRAHQSLSSLSAARRQPQCPSRRAPSPSTMADESFTLRPRAVPEAEKMTVAASILADAGQLLWLVERLDDGGHPRERGARRQLHRAGHRRMRGMQGGRRVADVSIDALGLRGSRCCRPRLLCEVAGVEQDRRPLRPTGSALRAFGIFSTGRKAIF